MTLVELAVLVLAVHRTTILSQEDDGPYRILARIRAALPDAWAPLGFCHSCLSIWTAALFAFAWIVIPGATWPAALILALSGGSVLLHRIGRE